MKKLAALAVLLLSFAASTATASAGLCSVTVRADTTTFHGYVHRSPATSCPFARRVTRASLQFLAGHGGYGDGDFYLRVASPVTGRVYRVHCNADGDLYHLGGMIVACRAGVRARVSYGAVEKYSPRIYPQ